MTRIARAGRGSLLGLALVLLVLQVSTSGAASAASAQPTSPDGITISGVDTSGYPDVTVEIAAPAAATGGAIDAAAVSVTENGQPVAFTLEPVPTNTLEVVLLFDTSGSMKGTPLTAAKRAVAGFLGALPSEVPVGVVSFADGVAVPSPMTTDRGATIASVDALVARGETALYDAMAFAPTLFSGSGADRQIVLLSDGGDTVSRTTLEQAVGVAAGIRTSIIQLHSFEGDQAALAQIAAAGHGTLSEATDLAALQSLYESVANSLVHRYRLHVTSTANDAATYAVSVTTPSGTLAASTDVTLPPATTLPATTAAPVTTPTSNAGAGSAVTTTAAAAIEGGGSASDSLLVAGAGMVFVALLLLASVFVPRRRRQRSLQMAAVRHQPVIGGTEDSGFGTQVSDRVERALEGHGRRTGLALALDVAHVRLRPGEFLVLVGSCAVTAAALLGFVLSWPGILAGLVLPPLVAAVYINLRIDRRRRAFLEQLPDVMQLLVNSLRSGFGLPQALDAVANQMTDPARTEFQRVLFEVRIGRDPSDALAAAALRMKSHDFDWVVTAMNINREVGGDLATILETVGETVRERLQLARQVRTLTAEGRLSAYILVALPFVLLGIIAVVNPGYYTPMKTSPGPALIALGAALLLVGTLWMRRIVKTHM